MNSSTPHNSLTTSDSEHSADTDVKHQNASQQPDTHLCAVKTTQTSVACHNNPRFTERQALALLLWLSPTITPKRWHELMEYLDHVCISSIDTLLKNSSVFDHIVNVLTPRNASNSKQGATTQPSNKQSSRTKSPTAIAAALRQTAQMERCLSWLALTPASAIYFPFDAHYPHLLSQLTYPPILFLHGDTTLLDRPQIAIVGSRNASHNALAFAQTMAQSLGTSGITVTSGLAYGIDTHAHLGALTTLGSTIAVLGQGIDIVYPKSNSALYQRMIAEGGLLVSEFALGTSPLPRHFPQRNRIISGLSLGTLIVEAALKSGSLITARTAMEQNRDVFAVPGSIKNPLSKGCHQLIKQGATLVETPSDILDVIAHRLSDYIDTSATQTRDADATKQKPPTAPLTADLFADEPSANKPKSINSAKATEDETAIAKASSANASNIANQNAHTHRASDASCFGNVTTELSSQILNALDFDQPKSLDAIAADCNIPIAQLHSAITQMVLFGAIHEVSTGLFLINT